MFSSFLDIYDNLFLVSEYWKDLFQVLNGLEQLGYRQENMCKSHQIWKKWSTFNFELLNLIYIDWLVTYILKRVISSSQYVTGLNVLTLETFKRIINSFIKKWNQDIPKNC